MNQSTNAQTTMNKTNNRMNRGSDQKDSREPIHLELLHADATYCRQ